MVEAIGNRYDGNKGRDLTTPSSNVDDGVCANPFFELTWSAHNSFVDAVKPKTKISVMPLLCDSPTDPSIQLTAMRHLQAVKQHIRGGLVKKLLLRSIWDCTDQ